MASVSASASFLGSHGGIERAHGLLLGSVEDGNAPGLAEGFPSELA